MIDKLKKYFWVFITIIVLSIYWLFKSVNFTSEKETTVIDSNSLLVDSLRNVIKSNQDKTNSEIESLHDSIKMYKSIINKNNQTLNQINKNTNEKVNNTVILNSPELFQFLTDRYKDSTRVKR
jgi:hypothetical protein